MRDLDEVATTVVEQQVGQPPAAGAAAAPAAAPSLADAKVIEFEKFARVDPKLPPVPSGAVKKTAGHDAQTISLAPSQGGWVEFTLAKRATTRS